MAFSVIWIIPALGIFGEFLSRILHFLEMRSSNLELTDDERYGR